MTVVTATILAILVVIAAALFHFEALEWLGRWFGAQRRLRRRHALTMVIALILVHMAEIVFFASAYAFAATLHIGGLVSQARDLDALIYLYFSAETYSTLGYGDIDPTGALRLVASVEPLAGLLLLAWSGAFLFSLVQRTVTEDGP